MRVQSRIEKRKATIAASTIQIHLVTLLPFGSRNDRLITNTARQGFYIVYLFRSDLSGVYLSLKKGVTSEMFTARMEARDVSVRSSVFLPKPAEKETLQ